jgi:hypothetical protein
VSLEGVEDDVEKGDGSAGITSTLPHKEYIIWDFWGEVECLLLFVLLLGWSFLIEKEYSKSRLGDHFKCPFFSGHEFCEGEIGSDHTHLLDEWVDNLRVGLKWHPILALCLFVHGYVD